MNRYYEINQSELSQNTVLSFKIDKLFSKCREFVYAVVMETLTFSMAAYARAPQCSATDWL